MTKFMDEYVKSFYATQLLMSKDTADLIVSDQQVNADGYPTSSAERRDLTERIEATQKFTMYLVAAMSLCGAWKFGKGIRKISRKLKRRC